MNIWWEGLTAFQQVMFIVAVSTTLIMVIQIIMMFIGGGDDAGFEGADGGDFDGSGDGAGDSFNDSSFGMVFGLRILSIRSVLAFFSIGSWVSFAFNDIMAWWGAMLIGLASGVVAAIIVAFLMKSIERLQSSGNIEIKNAVGKNGEVYLTIPSSRSSAGKVNVVVQERRVEFEAVTDSKDDIKTGAFVKVVGVVNEATLLVEQIK